MHSFKWSKDTVSSQNWKSQSWVCLNHRNVWIYVPMYVCMYLSMNVCMYLSMNVCMYICMYVCTYLCLYLRMYLWMYLCMYIWMYLPIYVCTYECTMNVCKGVSAKLALKRTYMCISDRCLTEALNFVVLKADTLTLKDEIIFSDNFFQRKEFQRNPLLRTFQLFLQFCQLFFGRKFSQKSTPRISFHSGEKWLWVNTSDGAHTVKSGRQL
jgi:hypothetical protein